MHFPVMILSEKPLDWSGIDDLIGPYTEDAESPMYDDDQDHKYDSGCSEATPAVRWKTFR